ncbi:uncharacterized protein C3orf84 homolog isoform X3 [Hemicordylus capensis]|uniref:uncharacterized protein C3orf84 homolog isoform X3 n=1 Tax=Hemicordylus capensis TaxID=884348 RepID=UPI002302F176|nr:uncharacterized protein C3orf84 homolog isoform X3 [Hemicordylus capensis]
MEEEQEYGSGEGEEICEETPSKHIFSKHDNRHAFPGSATYFENGLGRRRIEGSLPNTHNLIDWIPLKEELQRERPLVSSYQSDFRSREKVPQVLVHHSHQSLRGQPLYRTPSTTYQRTYRSYCLREPSLGALKEQEVVKEATPLQPTSSEPAPPPSSEPMALTASEPTRADASTTTREADVPFYGRSVHKPTRLTVSDCLRWHSC